MSDCSARLLLSLSLIIMLSLSASASEDPGYETINWDTAAPDLIHQRLHDAKTAGRLEAQFLAKTATLAVVDAMNDYDVLFYEVTIRVNDTNEVLYGSVVFHLEALVDQLDTIQFDFYRYMGLDSVKSGGSLLEINRDLDISWAILGSPLALGEATSIEVFYHGHPVEGGFQAFAFETRNSIPIIATLSEPYYARTWWPCKDRMTDKPDSMDIAIEVDTALYVASNGILDSTVASSANSHTFHYRVRYPIVTYLFSLAISKFTIWEQDFVYNGGLDTMPVIHHPYPDLYTYSLPRWGVTPSAIDILDDYMGPYPFLNEKYGHANFQWGGGMEHQTLTSMVGSSFGFSEPVVVHELGHQWWGDMITCASWRDIWLNEGWASYTEALYYQLKDGWVAYRNYMNNMAYTGGGTIYVADTNSIGMIFHGGRSYDKGAWVCHMLRGVLGDSLFFDGLEGYYYSEFQHGAATTEDFKNVFEATTGVELDWFFEDWIHGTYRPNYHWAFTTEAVGDGSYDLYLVAEQIQTSSPQVFRTPVPFFVDFTSGPDDTMTFVCDERRKLFKVNVPVNVASIALDPADWVLKYETLEDWGVRFIGTSDDFSVAQLGQAYLDTVSILGGSGNYNFSAINGTNLPPGLFISNEGIFSGIPITPGVQAFTLEVQDVSLGHSDIVEFTLTVEQCCGINTNGYTGNTDCDVEGKRNLSDITRLIDRVYVSKTILCCEASGNVDGDFARQINLSDIARLIDNVYVSKNETIECQ